MRFTFACARVLRQHGYRGASSIENVYRVAEGMTHSRPWVRSLFVKAVTSYVDDGSTPLIRIGRPSLSR